MDYTAGLKYHYRPQKGWINDPNGLVFFKGWYHIFYQHAPHFETPWKEPMHWGHARTRDFLTFEELPVALVPDMPYDNRGCWSGTALVKDDVLYLFYASLYVKEGDERPSQTVSMAYSADGIHFTKYEGNPVIPGYPEDGGPNFRDPAAALIDGKTYIVMASGHPESSSARLLLYTGDDMKHWRYAGIMKEWPDSRFAECPSFMGSGDKALLTASVVDQNGHFFSCMYGTFKNGKFETFAEGKPDQGPDQYAGQVFLDPEGRQLLITWIPGWPYAGYAEKNIGCMSVPRELTLFDGKVRGFPVKEIRHLLKDSDPALIRTEDGFIIPRTGRDPVVYKGEIRDLKLLRDEYVMEVFVNEGEVIYTVLL